MDIPGCDVIIEGQNLNYLCGCGPELVHEMAVNHGNLVTMVDRPEDVPEEIVKIAAYCPNGMDGPAALLAPRWGEPFHMAVAGLVWLDFSIATKGTGLAEMCGALGVSPEETAAFGDNWNDQAMLDMAGRCYLMEQADGALRRTLADSRAAVGREAPRSCRDVCDELEAILSCAQ